MENRRIIQVEEKVPLKLLIPLSIQHMFAMFGASVLVPFLFGISPAIVPVYERGGNPAVHRCDKGKGPGLLGIQLCLPGSGGNRHQQFWL